jgi:hypothetical protein
MTIMVDEVVVGCGASALTHLYYAIRSYFTKDPAETVVIGQDDLWKSIANVDPGHRFGQQPQLVNVQSTGTVAPTVDYSKKDPTGFQTASQIDTQLDAMRKFLMECGVKFYYGLAETITEDGPRILVKSTDGRIWSAKRVIVATGFGRSAVPRVKCPQEIMDALSKSAQWDMQAPDGQTYNCVVGGAEYLYATDLPMPPSHRSFRIAIQGASATSSWVLLRALDLARKNGNKRLKAYWITRSNFDQANPAGRNTDVLKRASENRWLIKADLKAIGSRPSKRVNDQVGTYHAVSLVLGPVAASGGNPPPKLSSLGEAYKKYYKTGYKDQRISDAYDGNQTSWKVQTLTEDKEVHVDHFVYATGADPSLPGGAGAILSAGLLAKLAPVIDMDRRFDDDPSATTLGFATGDGKVWVVGAAAFRGAGHKQFATIGGKFAHIADMMPEGGTPPEGIAVLTSAAKALTGYSEQDASKINLHTADFKEIETWFDWLYTVRTNTIPSATTKRNMADQIVAMRKHTVFGLSAEEIKALSNPTDHFWEDLFVARDGTRLIDYYGQLR